MDIENMYKSAAYELMPDSPYLPTRTNGPVNAGQLASLLQQWFPGHEEKQMEEVDTQSFRVPVAKPWHVTVGRTMHQWHVAEITSDGTFQIIYTLENTPGIDPDADRDEAVRLANDTEALNKAIAKKVSTKDKIDRALSRTRPKQSRSELFGMKDEYGPVDNNVWERFRSRTPPPPKPMDIGSMLADELKKKD